MKSSRRNVIGRAWHGSDLHSARQVDRSLIFEPLEERSLLSAAPVGGEINIGNFTNQGVAVYADGGFLVTWTANNGNDIMARRYGADGVAVGAAVKLNTLPAGNEQPSVAMDAAGNFVVAWSSAGADGDQGGIVARRFDAAINPLAAEFVVNTTTAGDQRTASVDMNDDGRFVVAWTGANNVLRSRRFLADGTPLGNDTGFVSSAGDDVAINNAGSYALISYGPRIRVYVYSAAGSLQNNWTSDPFLSAKAQIAGSQTGDFVVAWSQNTEVDYLGDTQGVYAQRLSATGLPLGSPFRVNTYTTGVQTVADVTMDSAGGFVVTWVSNGEDGSGNGVYAQAYASDGTVIGNAFRVNTVTSGDQTLAKVAGNARGDFVTTWRSSGLLNAQRYQVLAPPQATNLLPPSRVAITTGSTSTTELPSLIVPFSKQMDTTLGAAGANSVLNPANWQLTKDGVDITASIAGINYDPATYEATLTFASPLRFGAYQLTAKTSLQSVEGISLDGDRNGTAGDDYVINFNLAELVLAGNVVQVSDVDTATDNAAIAHDGAGNYVVVWVHDGDIMSRRFDAAGNPLTGPVEIGNGTGNIAAVSMNASGDYVIAFEAFDDFGYRIHARRFDAQGNALGPQFPVNAPYGYEFHSPSVGIDAAGNFVVAWNRTPLGSPASSAGFFARRFDASGAPLGAEFRVDPVGTKNATDPRLVMNASGDFAITWRSIDSSTQRPSVVGRLFEPSGSAVGQFGVVSTFSSMDSYALALNADAAPVIAWTQGTTIRAQRFSANGTVGAAFDVTTTSTNSGTNISLAMGAMGDFLVTWVRSTGIFVRRFNSLGMAQGNPFLVAAPGGTLAHTAVSLDHSGDAVVAWTLNGQSIRAQRLVNEGPFRVTEVTSPAQEVLTAGATAQMQVTELIVQLSRPASTSGGATGAHSVTNPANWQLIKDGNDISDLITGITFDTDRAHLALARPLRGGSYQLIVKDEIEDTLGRALDGDLNSLPGGDYAQVFSIQQVYGVERRILPPNAPIDQDASVGLADNGDFVVGWRYDVAQGPPSNIPNGVIQLFDGAGKLKGNPLIVDAWVINSGYAQVTNFTPTPSGDFLTPTFIFSPSKSNGRLFRINENGFVGDPIVVGQAPAAYGLRSEAATDAEGNFFLVWSTDVGDGTGMNMYGQRFDPSGQPLGVIVQLNSQGVGDQSYATMVMEPNGDFVVTWTSTIGDGSSYGVVARMFHADGSPRSPEFQVNSTGTNEQFVSTIGMDASGKFAIAWSGFGNAGYGAYLRRFDANGNPLGDEQLVSQPGADGYADMAMDAAGNMFVVWTVDAPQGEATYGQALAPDGQKIGSAFLITDPGESILFSIPQVAMNRLGDVVVAVGGGNGLPHIRRFAFDHAAVVDLNGGWQGEDYATTFTLSQPAVGIVDAGEMFVNDVPSPNLLSATIAIDDPHSGDVLSVDTSGTTIVASFVDGVLTLSGSDTVAHYQQVLRTATFSTAYDALDARAAGSVVDISFVVTDPTYTSAAAHSLVTIAPVPPASIVARNVFYNNSKYDGDDPLISPADDTAIATDKSPLVAGGSATFANFTNYDRGLNGIMIDVAGIHGPISRDDFKFKLGNNNAPGSWADAPEPITIGTRASAGLNGSDRIEIIWAEGAIKNKWLEVTLSANDHTRLAASDVFYFGNQLADVGNSLTDAAVNATDQLGVRNHYVFMLNPSDPASIQNPYDINRDGRVNATDELIARNNYVFVAAALRMLSLPPNEPLAAPLARPAAADSQLAFALALARQAPASGTAAIGTSTLAAPAASIAQPAALEPRAVAASLAALAFDDALASLSNERRQPQPSGKGDWWELELDDDFS